MPTDVELRNVVSVLEEVMEVIGSTDRCPSSSFFFSFFYLNNMEILQLPEQLTLTKAGRKLLNDT